MTKTNGLIGEEDKRERMEVVKGLYYGTDKTVKADDIYDKMNKDYEANMNALDYVGPSTLAAKVNYYAQDNKDVRILDVGCGTGWVAMELGKFGFRNIDGVDASKSLLDQAVQRKLYKNTLRAFVGEDQLNLDSESYDAVIGSGITHIGHLPPNAITDLFRLVKPGGLFMLLCNYEAWKLEEHLHIEMQRELDCLEKSKQWRRLEWSIMDDYAVYDDIQKGLFFVYRKAKD